MKVQLIDREQDYWFKFFVDLNGTEYHVTITLNQKGHFLEDKVNYVGTGLELEREGSEGDIHEYITDFIDENWNHLIS
jgi:hypothetical protein